MCAPLAPCHVTPGLHSAWHAPRSGSAGSSVPALPCGKRTSFVAHSGARAHTNGHTRVHVHTYMHKQKSARTRGQTPIPAIHAHAQSEAQVHHVMSHVMSQVP